MRPRIAVPAAAVTLILIATQTGAASACGRWLFGAPEESGARAGSAQPVAAPQDSSSRQPATAPTKDPTKAPSATTSTKRRGAATAVQVVDGATLGPVGSRFVLAAPSSIPAGSKVAFTLRGPGRATVVDSSAPYAASFDSRRMHLPNGTYAVTLRVVGKVAADREAHRLAARLEIRNATKSTGTTSSAPSKSKAATATTTTTATTAAKPTTTKSSSAPAAPKAEPTTPAARPAATEAAEVVRLTNAQRTANGCRALGVNALLTRSAQGHSDDMAAKNYFSHTGLDGRSPFDRMKAAGYSYSRAAENIAAGQPTPAAVVSGWMNSPGHRANILNCALTEIGVGVAKGGSYRIYWTQNFGTPR